jgi:hypothetical protein
MTSYLNNRVEARRAQDAENRAQAAQAEAAWRASHPELFVPRGARIAREAADARAERVAQIRAEQDAQLADPHVSDEIKQAIRFNRAPMEIQEELLAAGKAEREAQLAKQFADVFSPVARARAAEAASAAAEAAHDQLLAQFEAARARADAARAALAGTPEPVDAA